MCLARRVVGNWRMSAFSYSRSDISLALAQASLVILSLLDSCRLSENDRFLIIDAFFPDSIKFNLRLFSPLPLVDCWSELISLFQRKNAKFEYKHIKYWETTDSTIVESLERGAKITNFTIVESLIWTAQISHFTKIVEFKNSRA